MKKLLLICLLTVVNTYAQDDKDNYIYPSFGVDIKNSIIGSPPVGNKPALDYTIGLNIVTDNIDYGLGYEQFKALNFDRKFVQLGYHIKIGYITGTDIKFSINPALEYSFITRTYMDYIDYGDHSKGKVSNTSGWGTPSLNIAFQLDLNKNIAIQGVTNILPRPDLNYIYGTNRIILSNGIKLIYKFNTN